MRAAFRLSVVVLAILTMVVPAACTPAPSAIPAGSSPNPPVPAPAEQQDTTETPTGGVPLLPSPTPTPKSLPKVALFFLIDRSKSLKGCFPSPEADPRLEIPRFLITLLKSVPSRVEGWPKVGLAFFGEVENPFYALRPVQELDTSEERWKAYREELSPEHHDTNNDYRSYLEAAKQALLDTGADEKIIVIISDGKMDERKSGENERNKIQQWFQSQKPADVRVALFHMNCGVPPNKVPTTEVSPTLDPDMSLWNNPGIAGVFFYCEDSQYCTETGTIGEQLRNLIEKTGIQSYLPQDGGWWFAESEEGSEEGFMLTVSYYALYVDFTAIGSGGVEAVSAKANAADEISVEIPPANGGFEKRLNVNYHGSQTPPGWNIQIQREGAAWVYYFYEIHEGCMSLPQRQPSGTSFLRDVRFGREVYENEKTRENIVWNNEQFSVQIPYPKEVWLSQCTTGERSFIPEIYHFQITILDGDDTIVETKTKDMWRWREGNDVSVDFKDICTERKDLDVFVDIIRSQGDKSVSVDRKDLSLACRFFPEATIENGMVTLQYTDGEKYYEGGQLGIYPLTTRRSGTPVPTPSDGSSHTPCPNPPNYFAPITIGRDTWYPFWDPSLEKSHYDLVAEGEARVPLEDLLENLFGEKCSWERWGYTKMLLQREDGDKSPPYATLCDIVSGECVRTTHHVVVK